MRFKELGFAIVVPFLLAGMGCDDDESSAQGDGGACWNCAGAGGSSSGKGGSTGKGDYTFTVSGSLDRGTGDGSYRLQEADETGTICDVTYAVTGATEDTSCTACTFAYTMQLSMADVTVAEGCSGSEALDGTEVGYGHDDPDVLYSGKSGDWESIGEGSTVTGDAWSFTAVFDLSAGGK